MATDDVPAMATTRSPGSTRVGRPATGRVQPPDNRFARRRRKPVTVLGASLAAALLFFAGVGVATLVITQQVKSNIGKLAAAQPTAGQRRTTPQHRLPPPLLSQLDRANLLG